MSFTRVDDDQVFIEEIDEINASSAINFSCNLTHWTTTAATNRHLIRFTPDRCISSTFIYQTNVFQTLFVARRHLILVKFMRSKIFQGKGHFAERIT